MLKAKVVAGRAVCARPGCGYAPLGRWVKLPGGDESTAGWVLPHAVRAAKRGRTSSSRALSRRPYRGRPNWLQTAILQQAARFVSTTYPEQGNRLLRVRPNLSIEYARLTARCPRCGAVQELPDPL